MKKTIPNIPPETELEVFKKIEAYILGELRQSDIEELWETLLSHPNLFKQFETALNFRSLVISENSR